MSDVKYERGRTLTYPTLYPKLRITPVFAHKGDFMWVESIICKYDSDIDDIDEPEFEFIRSTVHDERNDALKAENAKLRELAAEAIRLIQADGPDCGLCKHYDECWTGEAMDYSPNGCVICNEARDLGIEV